MATVIPYTTNYDPQNQSILSTGDAQKSSLSLQESGIFEEEEVDCDQIDGTKEPKRFIGSPITQTEVQSGELLQQVQRLQELRVRIQQRDGVKISQIPSLSTTTTIVGDDRKNETHRCECNSDESKAKTLELEERVNVYETERRIAKQREEDLLDENYKLTEKLYCLEADLKKLSEIKSTRDVEIMTDLIKKNDNSQQIEFNDMIGNNGNNMISKCQDLYRAALVHLDETKDYTETETIDFASNNNKLCVECSGLLKDSDDRMQQLARTEICLRQQILNLEHREVALFETLRYVDENWTRLEMDYKNKQSEMNNELTAQKELNCLLNEKLKKFNDEKSKDESMEVDGINDYSVATQTDDYLPNDCTKCQKMISSTVIDGNVDVSLQNKTWKMLALFAVAFSFFSSLYLVKNE